MKKISKVLALLTAVAMVMSLFVACNKKEEEAVRKVVEGYSLALKEVDLEKAQSYVDKECDLYNEIGQELDESVYAEWGKIVVQGADMPAEYAVDIAALFENLTKELAKKQEISIDDVNISDDDKSAEVKCSGKTVDNDYIGDAISMETFEKIAEEMYEYSNLDNEEMYKVFEEQYKRAADNAKTKDVFKTIKLELKNEEWKIVDIAE